MNKTPLDYMTGEMLMNTVLEPIQFVVSGLVPQGLHILAGAPKVGKSWLALWLCLCVSKGEPVWELQTVKSDVLYLCLEDSYARIQNRLFDITDCAPDNLFFSIMSEKLRDGLEEQIEGFLSSHPETVLVVIDTLQRVRKIANDVSPYASDYRDLGVLKALADKHHIAIVLIHHLRKMNDDDPMNMISGTTGISGAADSSYVLRKDKRGGKTATLYCTGRDIEYRELSLEFDSETHIWNLLSNSVPQEKDPSDSIIDSLSAFLSEHKTFSGTATELAEALKTNCNEIPSANVLMKKLLRCQSALSDRGISLATRRTHDRRELSLRYECDGCVSNDGKSDMVPVSDLLSQPSQLSQGEQYAGDQETK